MCNQWCKDFSNRIIPVIKNTFNILEVGSRDVNGSPRDKISPLVSGYTGCDLIPGNSVDVIADATCLDEHFRPEQFDIVMTLEMLEHCHNWKKAIIQMLKCLRLGGFLLITTRSPGYPKHNYPSDYWRFSADDMVDIFSTICKIITVEYDFTRTDCVPCGVGVIIQKAVPIDFGKFEKFLDSYNVLSINQDFMLTNDDGKLDALGVFYGTDKASACHNYLKVYENFFRSFKYTDFTLLELGVGPKSNMGKSLLMWKDYFPRATIVGADIQSDATSIAQDRIKIEVGDAGDLNFLKMLADKYKPALIIDDASHRWEHQILSFEVLFPALVPNGLFICEVLDTSFDPLRTKFATPTLDAATYFTKLALAISGKCQGHPYLLKHPLGALQLTLVPFVRSVTLIEGSVIVSKISS